MNFLKKPACLSMLAAIALTCCISTVRAEEKEPQLPKPTAEHQWLQQLVGKWDANVEAFDPATKALVKSKGTNNIESLGGFWITNEVSGNMMNQPFKGLMTTGYDDKSDKFVSTWVDSMTAKLWQSEGTLDASKKVLTLQAEGECPMQPGKMVKMKDQIEVKDPNHVTYTSFMQDEKGEWIKVMTSEATRHN